MNKLELSKIDGCISPVTGTSSGYDNVYNTDQIITFYKIDRTIEFEDVYMVSVTFQYFVTLFKFDSESDRDTFYDTLMAL